MLNKRTRPTGVGEAIVRVSAYAPRFRDVLIVHIDHFAAAAEGAGNAERPRKPFGTSGRPGAAFLMKVRGKPV